MKIYLGESKNFMGYDLLGDLGQEYIMNIYPKNKDLNINIYEKCLEMCLFYIYSNKPIYTKESPKIYLYKLNKNNITQIDILNFKELILKNEFFNKYKRDTSQTLNVIDLKKYTDEDKQQISYLNTQLEIKERDMLIRTNNFLKRNGNFK